MSNLEFVLIWVFAPTILVVVIAIVLSIFRGPPKKKYWGTGESWWPEEKDW